MTTDRDAQPAAALPPALADLAVTWVPRGTLVRPDPATARGVLWAADASTFYFEIPDVAGYSVTDGRTLQVESHGGTDEKVLRYLVSTPVAAAFLQRGIPVLHAAVATRDGRAVVIAGDSASGKSVLLADLISAGWDLLSDDLAAISRAADGSIVALPTDRAVRLNSDAAARLGAGAQAAQLGPATPIGAVWILRTTNDAEIKVETLTGLPRFTALTNLAYNSRIAAALLDRRAYLDVIGALVSSSVPVSVLTRPRGRWTHAELSAIVTRATSPTDTDGEDHRTGEVRRSSP